MSGIECKRLSDFSRAVRESSLKRLKAVPFDYANWRATSESMSPADIAQHLTDADQWLILKLEKENIDPLKGIAASVNITEYQQYLDLLNQLCQMGESRAHLIENLDDSKLEKLLYDSRFGGDVTVWWIIVRGNLDHEIHHRGQIAAYLRMLNLKI
jgi:uncharacterized damage-inducible protein DinB